MSNRRPVDYKQYDSRWAAVAYNGPNETGRTIKSSGCGPTSAAMAIAALKDAGVTPVETCAWSRAHGYKYKNQGTAYSYFVPQLAAYEILCRQLSDSTLYNQPDSPVHDTAKELIGQGYWAIALMGTRADGSRGTWTTGGHYVLVWDWDTKVRICDPIHQTGSNKYCDGDPDTFRDECRNYWLVDARAYNGKPAEEPVSVRYLGEVATSSSPLNCRSFPGGLDVVRQYQRGERVTITREWAGWGHTGEGWVDLRYIRKLEEETDMTADEVKKLVKDSLGEAVSEAAEQFSRSLEEKLALRFPVYEALVDVPEWYHPTIKRLVDRGALKGTGAPGVLNVSEEMCRIFTILERMGELG